MPRDQFISDNLIDIRDRLRENYQSIKTSRKQDPAAPSAEPSAAPEIHLDLKAPVLQAQPAPGRSADREFNEFSGALEHDLAAVAAELAFAEEQHKALEKFREQLKSTAENLNRLPAGDSPDYFREFDRLRITYFQVSGAAAPYRKQASSGAVKPAAPPEEPARSSKNILPAAAIVLAAAMISLTLILLFS